MTLNDELTSKFQDNTDTSLKRANVYLMVALDEKSCICSPSIMSVYNGANVFFINRKKQLCHRLGNVYCV